MLRLAIQEWVNGQQIQLLNANTGSIKKTLRYQGKEESASFIAFSPDGKMLASGGWHEIQLLNTQNGQLKQTINSGIDTLVYFGDGKTLANSSWRRIQFLDLLLFFLFRQWGTHNTVSLLWKP